MEKKNVEYTSPRVDILEVQIERGFATSYSSNYFDPSDWECGDTSNWEY